MPNHHSIYIKWGKLQIGAVGIPAVLTVLVAIVVFGLFRGAW